MSDVNLKSYVGPDFNGKRVDCGSLPVVATAGIASALKFTSGLSNFWFRCDEVRGGSDACVDVNNLCRNVEIYAGRMFPNGQFAATIKGGAQGISLYGELQSHAQVADVIIGDWSDQSHAKTTGVVLGITTKTPDPVRVLVLNGDAPLFVPGTGPYEFLFPSPNIAMHGFFVWGFETLRRWGFYREKSNK